MNFRKRLGVFRMENKKNTNPFKTLKRLLGYFKGRRLLFSLCVLLAVISALCLLLGTYLLKDVVDGAIANDDMDKLLRYILMIASAYLVGCLSNLTYLEFMARIAQKVTADIRNDIFKHMTRLPYSYFGNRPDGEIMSHFTNDIDALNNALNVSFINIVYSFSEAVGLIIFLMVLNIYLSLIVVFFLAIMAIFLIRNMKKCRKYYALNQKELSDVNAYAEERMHGIKEEKIFMHQKENLEGFHAVNEKLRKTATKAFYHTQISVPVIVSLSYFNFAISALVGSIFAINNLVSYGVLASYLVYVRQSAQPLNYLITHTNTILNALAGCDRIFSFLDIEDESNEGKIISVHYVESEGEFKEVDDKSAPLAWRLPNGRLIPIKGDIQFKDMSFSYDGKRIILDDISLYANPNERIAFIGSTGAGKTTIISLLSRLYDIDEGEILYDGIDIKDIDKHYLRKSIAVVNQDTHLFEGSIKDNLKLVKGDASDEEIIDALRLANANRLTSNLKDGVDTLISNSSTNISSGEKQLISIARAIISNSPVLVLDEATSNVDTKTERLIQEGMSNLSQNKTVLVIAHRLSTVVNSDAILYLRNGKITERGTHLDLIALKGEYYRLLTGKDELS